MIEHIIDFCARNKFLVLLITGVAALWGVWAIYRVPLDALPDLSDTQVIIYSRWDRSPDIIEDQVTYPIVTAMLGTPRVKAVRGFSDFGFSYVYVIFQDGTDIYWARSRTLEYLSKILPTLPEGVKTQLGPDATGVGWVFQYALVDETGQQSLADLRSFQDWYLRYYLQSVPGVAEVASTGGFVKQYQVQVDPNRLAAYHIPLMEVVEAIRKGNNDVGGRLVEFSGTEYMVRGRGYAKSILDLEEIVVGGDDKGVPILVRDIAKVTLGADIRRGVVELDGKGEVVGGIIVMRHGENALRVIERVKERLKELEPTLPAGVKIVTAYDRSELILRSIDTLKSKLFEEILIVSAVILLFLQHIPSAIVPIFTLPIAVVIAFIPMYWLGLTSNVMSLGGIAIAIGAMVDAAIVVVENVHKKLERWELEGKIGDANEIIIGAVKEVGRASFFSLLVISISFIPVFTLEAQEGRLFKPLAYTKNIAMALAAVLAITLDPAMRLLFTRRREFHLAPKWFNKMVNAVLVGKMEPEEKHPLSRFLFRMYEPICNWVIRHPKVTFLSAILLMVATVPIYFRLGSEFMPTLNEGALLYMPTTVPGISVTEAAKLLQVQDKILMSFPEVERVFGKAGRVESSTDPAPFSMMETTVLLKPMNQWRKGLTWEKLVDEMDHSLQIPGQVNAWTMPIKNRIDMLSTGVRTPVGIKILGSDITEIERIGQEIERIMKTVPGTRSVFAERVAGGYFLDFDLKRDQLARYGLSIDDVEMVILSAIGGEVITTTVEGRERYGVSVRYPRELRDDLEKLKRVLIPVKMGSRDTGISEGMNVKSNQTQIPLAQVADIQLRLGPSMIRNENGLLSGYVYVDMTGRDVGSFVHDAKQAVREQVKLPVGYALTWSGQYEYMERVRQRLYVTIPLTLFLIFFLLYMNTRSFAKTLIVLLAVPFSLVGAIWFLWILGYNMSIAVWVGMIALMGVDAETGVFMLLFLDLAYEERKRGGLMRNEEDLREAVIHGAVKRLRPKLMTALCLLMGLLPIMWAGTHEIGADVMKRIAAPMVGGITTSFMMELLVYPAIYAVWKWNFEMKKGLTSF